jgi:N6-adenosine-specific RNA methylase IME4
MTNSIVIRRTGLLKLDQATKALAEASMLSEVKDIRDKAEAIRKYAAASGAGLDIQNAGAELKLRAERKAGILIPEQFPHGGDRKSTSYDTSLKEVGITYDQSSRWQQEASIPEKEFEQHIIEIKAEQKELTSAGVLRLARLYQPKPEPIPLPEGKYKVIYADPCWQFDNAGFKQSAESQYPTMETEEIIRIPIQEKTYEDSVLFLWATNAMLEDALKVMKEWKFNYKSNMVWIKNKGPGIGWFVDSRHELLLIGTKEGNVHPTFKPISYFYAPVRKHSQKPETVYELIEKMYKGPYLELFARNKRKRPGWSYWGLEAKD